MPTLYSYGPVRQPKTPRLLASEEKNEAEGHPASQTLRPTTQCSLDSMHHTCRLVAVTVHEHQIASCLAPLALQKTKALQKAPAEQRLHHPYARLLASTQ